MINIELFNPEKHYEMVAKWWSDQKWPVIPLSHLSSTGIMVSVNEKPAACAWLYKTDSAFCVFEFLVANPEVRRNERSEALSELIESAKSEAKNLGYQSIFMSIRNGMLGTRLEKGGFTPTDTNMNNYICNLQGGN